jgi:hypothetical protein
MWEEIVLWGLSEGISMVSSREGVYKGYSFNIKVFGPHMDY